MPTCVECSEKPKARGMCSRHYNKAYYQANADRMRARSRSWYRRNPEKAAEQRRRRDPEMLRRLARRHYWANRLGRIAASANSKARSLGVAGVLTADGILARFSYFGYRCWVCGGEGLTVDHVKAFGAGGLNVHANIRPACQSCNSAKSWEGRRP